MTLFAFCNIELKKNEDLSPKQLIHPKYYVLEKLLLQEITINPTSRILVFVKLRDSVKNIVNKLKSSNSEGILKPARFVGQATKSKDDKGLSQKKQLEILKQFKQGHYNILVSTNVGEEGLDIAECDLVIFYDVVASEIRFIQRKGRTARHREGKVIILYCKDTHDEIYMHIALNKLKKMNVNLKSDQHFRKSYTKVSREVIIEEKKLTAEKRSGGIFIGTVDYTQLINRDTGSEEFRSAIVTFPPGTRNKFHVHDHEQILYIIEGKGIVATEKEERLVEVGDIILIPTGENHWHGATQDSTFSHLFITRSGTKTTF